MALSDADAPSFRETDLMDALSYLLHRKGLQHIETEYRIPGGRIDIAVLDEGNRQLIDVLNITPQTRSRLSQAINRLKSYGQGFSHAHAGEYPRLSLFVPGPIAPRSAPELIDAGIDLLDMRWLQAEAAELDISERVEDIATGKDRGRRIESRVAAPPETLSDALASQLLATPPGRDDWAAYQKLCNSIFDYLFSPPLGPGIFERSNHSGVNRRDIIMPNYSIDGFWRYMRERYHADHIVIDAKNYAREVKKNQMLQMANYLSPHGTGLFGMIATRNGQDVNVPHILREQWMVHHKLILTLTDVDLIQMLLTKKEGGRPELLIQQKIEDFRLSI